MNKIVKFHIDNNYYVNIKSISNFVGCTSTFPPNLFTHQPGYIKTYTVNEEQSFIEVFSSINKQKCRRIDVNKTAIRLLITEDILLNTIKRGMSRHLIVIDGGKYNNTFHILKINLTKEELEEEKDLCIRFRKLLLGKDRKESNGIDISGFEEVLECFENGGL
jgi:hypothetical protein